ncbi:8099_t:CDS:2 [Dentiscutata erythropus]|uniref:8099_t:CDS:1 n=1 Tax=Dentiscutata erythropus TaxID=1348616 RepID=A0A9N9FVY7_9GLOM|nr:8099_t:CDS:2 [Dentiscutata erythropus]
MEISTLRLRNRKRNSNNLHLNLCKSKSRNSSTVKSEANATTSNVSSNIISNEDEAENQHFSDDLQEDDPQEDGDSYFSDLQGFDKSDDQDDYQSDSNYSDQQVFDDSSDLFEEKDKFSDEIKAANFIFEKPASQLPQNLENIFSPYFANFTEMSLFTWVTKHSISTVAFQELVTVISNDQFNLLDMPRNVLKNSILFSKMYFGSGIEGEDRAEFWHGRIWAESLLFSDDTLNIIFPDILQYSMIPTQFRSAERYSKSQGRYLWLANEQYIIMPATRIRSQVKVWLIDQPRPEEQEYFVDEIVYYHNQSWKYIAKSSDPIDDLEFEDNEANDMIFCNDSHFVKIHTQKPWKNKEIRERGFGGWNFNTDNNSLHLDLYKAYCEEFNMFAALNTYKVAFFDYISYVVMEDNDDLLEHNGVNS